MCDGNNTSDRDSNTKKNRNREMSKVEGIMVTLKARLYFLIAFKGVKGETTSSRTKGGYNIQCVLSVGQNERR